MEIELTIDELSKDWTKFFNSLKTGEIKALKVFVAYQKIYCGGVT